MVHTDPQGFSMEHNHWLMNNLGVQRSCLFDKILCKTCLWTQTWSTGLREIKKKVLYHIRQTLSFVLPTTFFVLSEKAIKEQFISSPHGDQMFLVLIIFFRKVWSVKPIIAMYSFIMSLFSSMVLFLRFLQTFLFSRLPTLFLMPGWCLVFQAAQSLWPAMESM